LYRHDHLAGGEPGLQFTFLLFPVAHGVVGHAEHV